MICYINCDKQLWEIEETGEKEKTVFSGSVPTIFVEECRVEIQYIPHYLLKWNHPCDSVQVQTSDE